MGNSPTDLSIVNLGCGTKASSVGINIDFSIYLLLKKYRVDKLLPSSVIGKQRKINIAHLPENIICHNLAKGIPLATNSAGAVYHSHLLEHIDKHQRQDFLREILRVLKPGGIHRICVPDLMGLVEQYRRTYSLASKNEISAQEHEKSIEELYEQSVRRESFGSSQQTGARRWIENMVLGDARKRGETHQWMYDQVNLSCALKDAGFLDTKVKQFSRSEIAQWHKMGLEIGADGEEYKKGSLYLECKKPSVS